MKKCLIDTCAMSLIWNGEIPGKWSDIWRNIRMGGQGIILIEPLVGEMYYKNAPKLGLKEVKNNIMGLKGFRKAEVYKLKDSDAIEAGKIKLEHRDLSLVDCFIMAVAKRHRAVILTTDPGIRDAAREMRIDVNFMVLRE